MGGCVGFLLAGGYGPGIFHGGTSDRILGSPLAGQRVLWSCLEFIGPRAGETAGRGRFGQLCRQGLKSIPVQVSGSPSVHSQIGLSQRRTKALFMVWNGRRTHIHIEGRRANGRLRLALEKVMGELFSDGGRRQ